MNIILTQLLENDKNALAPIKANIQRKESLIFELNRLNILDKLTLEKYACAMAWLEHSNLSVKEIIEIIKNS